MGLVLLLGGARSGKSALAVTMAAEWHGDVLWVATAEARDEEMACRIRRHRAERPAHWRTVEDPVDVDSHLSSAPENTFVVVDCLTLWVSNLIEREHSDDEIEARARATARTAASRAAPTVAISNEVGWGIVPENPLARRYRDLLGRVNAMWAGAADRALLVVAGRTLELSDAKTQGGDVHAR